MGDRISVRLIIEPQRAYQVIGLFKVKHYYHEVINQETHGEQLCLQFNEVNYGELGIEKALMTQGIAYTKKWDAGGGFTAGEEHLRFTDNGTAILQTVPLEEMNPDIYVLLQCQTATQVIQRIQDHARAVIPLPWKYQEHFGLQYKAHALIGTAKEVNAIPADYVWQPWMPPY